MGLSDELKKRGLIQHFSAATLEEVFDGEARVVYHGIDPSADSAHAGNLLVWVLLKRLKDAGHRVVFLVGGGTGLIGDPKPDAERALTEPEEVERRVEKLKRQAQGVFGDEVVFVNNRDWLDSLALIPFLRDIGKCFTVNELIKKEAIASRLLSEAGISYTEFAYPLLQAYDFWVLYRRYGCAVQIGGSDQWGNMVAGVDLIRRLERGEAFAVTVPLVIDKVTGKKFGKSEGNAVWLDPQKTSPFAFYQFWYNTSDDNVIDYLKLFTQLPLSDIDAINQRFLANPGAREAQRILAHEVTALVHGLTTSLAAERASVWLFGEEDLFAVSAEERRLLLENAPSFRSAVGSPLIDIIVGAGLASSKSEARTFIQSGAITLGGRKVDDATTRISADDFIDGLALLRRGKKQAVVIIQSDQTS
jgi:tyrosyl-tRNA synthetase